MSRTDRIRIEVLLRKKIPIKEIVAEIGVHISTIYREIKRGKVLQLTSELIEEHRYCGDTAHGRYRQHLREKGPGLKIGDDRALADHIENKILFEDYSPAAVLGEIARTPGLRFSTTISESTLYSYIEKGVFLTLTNTNLPIKGKRKKKHRTIKPISRPPQGRSIERRPEEVAERTTSGHWEMDTVLGPKGSSPRLLVLTERITRKFIGIRVPDGSSKSVIHALDKLEKQYGKQFSLIFRTITVDNGPEFSDCAGMERSRNGKKKRTDVYYCRPYAAHERGTVEKQNQMLRRRFPKGTDFRKICQVSVDKAVEWLNELPREIFDFDTADNRFQEALEALV
ncbi:MAG: IS30 family transposase [Oscillospiraceae bacterium]|nr:IS30 family transposase [Oscillospiraceae bacterium]